MDTTEVKKAFYRKLEEIMVEWRNKAMVVLLGDWNARVQRQQDGEDRKQITPVMAIRG